MQEGSLFSASLPALISCIFIIPILTGVKWYFIFDLLFLDDEWHWASLHVSVRLLYVFGEMSIKVLCPFFLIIFLMFIFERERERESEHEQGRGRQRGRHRIQSRLQALSCQHRAQYGAWIHEQWDHDLSQNLSLNRLNHTGAPPLPIFNWTVCLFVCLFRYISISNYLSLLTYLPTYIPTYLPTYFELCKFFIYFGN